MNGVWCRINGYREAYINMRDAAMRHAGIFCGGPFQNRPLSSKQKRHRCAKDARVAL